MEISGARTGRRHAACYSTRTMKKLQDIRGAARLAAIVLLMVPGLPAGGVRAQPLTPTQLCRAAIATAETEAGIPAGLLQAIGRVESGRADPVTGEFGPWPWALNAEGRGHFFPDRAAAIAAVQAMRTRGVRLIDAGCMQVNLHVHPHAFPDLESAFDPLANARYAARFLTELHARSADWLVAAGHYHSHTPHLTEAYRTRVAAAWPQAQARLAEDRALMGRRGGGTPPVVALSNGVERAQILPSAGGTGRGLDDYRARPVPVTGRAPLALAAAPVPLTAAARRLPWVRAQ